MIIEPVKSDLTSWQICLCLAPLPEKILKETTPQPSTPARKIPKRNHKGSRVKEIADKLNIKVVSVRIIRARYRKRIGIDTPKPEVSTKVRD